MAFLQCDFFSEALGMSTSMNVILPQQVKSQIGLSGKIKKKNFPVMYLLHGLSDDHTIWMRRTSIERYVSPLGIAVIMPRVDRSYYTDMKYGLKYWTFISEELPKIVKSFFPISEKREDTFVAGLSMGGYGSFKLALNFPERFVAAASFSGALDMVSLYEIRKDDIGFDYKLVWGGVEEIKNTNNDLFYLLQKNVKDKKKLPVLYQYCGTNDFLYDCNLKFKSLCESLKVDLTYTEDDGLHNWKFWDIQIENFLKFLCERKLI